MERKKKIKLSREREIWLLMRNTQLLNRQWAVCRVAGTRLKWSVEEEVGGGEAAQSSTMPPPASSSEQQQNPQSAQIAAAKPAPSLLLDPKH